MAIAKNILRPRNIVMLAVAIFVLFLIFSKDFRKKILDYLNKALHSVGIDLFGTDRGIDFNTDNDQPPGNGSLTDLQLPSGWTAVQTTNSNCVNIYDENNVFQQAYCSGDGFSFTSGFRMPE